MAAELWPRRRLLSIFTALFFCLGWASTRFGDLLRQAFPPDPMHFNRLIDWRMSLGRIAAPFRAFLERARLHEQFSGDGYRLDTLSRVT